MQIFELTAARSFPSELLLVIISDMMTNDDALATGVHSGPVFSVVNFREQVPSETIKLTRVETGKASSALEWPMQTPRHRAVICRF